jgi:hypothetical protein
MLVRVPLVSTVLLAVLAFHLARCQAQGAQAPKPAGQPTQKPADAVPSAGPQTRPAMPQAEMTPEMKAAMEAMPPGPAHQRLVKLAGDWMVKAKLVAPGAPAEETEGTAKITSVMEGRFIHEEDSGLMMGMPYKGAKLMGYNNGSKKYEAVWTYTLGTGMMTMTGTSPDEGKTIKLAASFANEIGVQETLNVTYTFSDDDHFTVTLDGGKMPDGSPGPVMESAYTRKK